MTLYEMTQAATELYEMLAAEEIDEETVADTLEAMGVGDKLEDYCKVIRQFEADSAAYKAEKDRFAEKRKRAKNAISRLKNAIQTYMMATGTEKAKCGVFDIRVSHSRRVEILDETLIPEGYRKEQKIEFDVAGLRRALLAGEEISGAALAETDNISIR